MCVCVGGWGGVLHADLFSHYRTTFNLEETRQTHWLELTDLFLNWIHLMDVCYCGSFDVMRHPALIADWWRETCHTLHECDGLIKRQERKLKEWEICGRCSEEQLGNKLHLCYVCSLTTLVSDFVSWHTPTYHTIHFSPHWVTCCLLSPSFSPSVCVYIYIAMTKSLEVAVVVLLMLFMYLI